ncbi:arad-like aldolase/epimerase [Sistotremastrum niveocremeum HHB9708]|uniref:Arad-like aldolase/epimerase n=1 Tax=Sistotremastrum niveocremeum HHB9708 TaxID=1314777 RepID=A0A164MQM1_9AGAM|nr:arad-like aldolase/epimerase [Sistotremastrum niveocremeum HHB9708]
MSHSSRETAPVIGANVSSAFLTASVDLLDSNHILHFLGVLDAFGHVSFRNPDNSSQFVMSFSLAPALSTSQSLVLYDIETASSLSLPFNTSVQPSDIPAPFSERFIHSEIYKKFPNVTSVVHSHATPVLPFGVAGIPLRAQMHTAGSLGTIGTPIFDYGKLPPSVLPENAIHDTLVRTPALGAALAETFSSSSATVLMRSHGMAVVGPSVRVATLRSFYTVEDAKVQLSVAQLGLGAQGFQGLNAREATDSETTIDGIVGRAWQLWQAQVDLQGSGLYINDLRQ